MPSRIPVPDAEDAGDAALAAPDTPHRERAELQRQGAKAALRGEALAANPMLDAINRPLTTGESESVWAARRDDWERGHSAQQDAGAMPATAVAGSAAELRARDEALFGVTRVLTFSGARGLSTASGFFFEHDGRLFLVTSRHVLFDAPTAHAPDRIEIDLHTDARDLTRLARLSILLHRDGLSVWHEALDSGGVVDVAAVELDRQALPVDAVLSAFGPQHLAAGFDLFDVGDRLVIPAFPLGFFDTVHQLPVVRQASVASCYGVRFQGLGYFLTDGRMHRGCSGAPVLARVDAPAAGRSRWCLLGVHSSRMDMATRDPVLDEQLGLNCAWYADVLMTLTAHSRQAQS
ncbi:serine protease [Pelomonas cellulosilytica]|uniref:Serine protease n=1 Tax=Pelomonas cellulosilytica TaxID=2906762 RepID=A0ABS8XWM6_9BURK|nr:serine protease [Pelomonas sp. P8]MCE4555196.1 serine protease [Pelomonas sp. P8]